MLIVLHPISKGVPFARTTDERPVELRTPTGRRAADLQLHRLPRADDGRGDGRQGFIVAGRHEGTDCGVGPVEAVVRGLHGDGLGGSDVQLAHEARRIEARGTGWLMAS